MTSSMLSPILPSLPRVLHPSAPYVAALHPCLSHLDAMHLSLCTGSLLGTASCPALLNVELLPSALAPLLAETFSV